MIELLAQTSQPAWRTWAVADWVTLIGAISGAIVLILNTWYSRRSAIAAESNQGVAVSNTTRIAALEDPPQGPVRT